VVRPGPVSGEASRGAFNLFSVAALHDGKESVMEERRTTKLLQNAVCFLGAAVLLSTPIAQAITYDVSLDWTLYGDLNQNTIPVIGGVACGPTSAVNSFVYLQNSYPEVYGHSLVPDLNGTPNIYENGELVAVAEILAGSSYMNLTLDFGTWGDMFIYGKEKYIEERVPGSTVYAAQYVMGWPRPPVPAPPWFESVIPTWSFLYGALVGSADLEIAINGWVDHFLTPTGLYWDDTDNDGFIDDAEDAWMDFVDPWTGAWDTADIWQEGPSILTNYAGGNSFISTAVAETPIPEPSSILLGGLGLLGLAAYGRRRRGSL
jgi:MYXO-CTERM domain-containing protein